VKANVTNKWQLGEDVIHPVSLPRHDHRGSLVGTEKCHFMATAQTNLSGSLTSVGFVRVTASPAHPFTIQVASLVQNL
jgi:hypothetical protein